MSIQDENRNLIEKIKNGETVVVNRKRHHEAISYAKNKNVLVRCDRQSKFGNPHFMKYESQRMKVVVAYWNDIKHDRTKLTSADFASLYGKTLMCWCYPKKCHCEVLRFVANKLQDGLTLDEIKKL